MSGENSAGFGPCEPELINGGVPLEETGGGDIEGGPRLVPNEAVREWASAVPSPDGTLGGGGYGSPGHNASEGDPRGTEKIVSVPSTDFEVVIETAKRFFLEPEGITDFLLPDSVGPEFIFTHLDNLKKLVPQEAVVKHLLEYYDTEPEYKYDAMVSLIKSGYDPKVAMGLVEDFNALTDQQLVELILDCNINPNLVLGRLDVSNISSERARKFIDELQVPMEFFFDRFSAGNLIKNISLFEGKISDEKLREKVNVAVGDLLDEADNYKDEFTRRERESKRDTAKSCEILSRTILPNLDAIKRVGVAVSHDAFLKAAVSPDWWMDLGKRDAESLVQHGILTPEEILERILDRYVEGKLMRYRKQSRSNRNKDPKLDWHWFIEQGLTSEQILAHGDIRTNSIVYEVPPEQRFDIFF